MAGTKTGSFVELLSDKFSDVWKLLSETTVFLSRTSEFDAYEAQLRSWRAELKSAGRNTEAAQRIRTEITELRKQLRLQGYDLSLGKQNLIIDGFRNDTCLGEGFRRAVIFIAPDALFFNSGEDNHIVLAERLERRLEAEALARRTQIRILDRHYLWYRRDGANLILSGADTEIKEDFERLSAMCRANSLLFLSALKSLR
jgi:hypothetical protein